MRVIDKNISNTANEFIYISLDTSEGGCVGHWIWECALHLPNIKSLQIDHKIPFKILLHEKKNYKINILSDFGFHECDIVYSTNMVQDPDSLGDWQEKCVYPEQADQYILYLPKFFYLWKTGLHNKILTGSFISSLNDFRIHYIKNISDTTKTIPISYIARSKIELYARNSRIFLNENDFCKILDNNMVNIIHTDTLTSFNPQFHDVIKSKIIIIEMGSAFTINAGFIASNSHIIIINDFWNYDIANEPFFHTLRFLMHERNNTVEIFSVGFGRDSFTVDIDAFKTRINELTNESQIL